MIDFTTTAMDRPELIYKTYQSFSENLNIDLKQHNLYINIDCVRNNEDYKLVINVCKKFFKNIIYNVSTDPNFSRAINWCWSNANSDFIFHLEDDWILLEKVDVLKLINNFENNKNLNQVPLRAYNDDYGKYCLSPSIISKNLYKAVAGNLNEKLNPEVQLRGSKFGIKMPELTNSKDYIKNDGMIIVYPPDKNKIIVKDIGKNWIKSTKFRKPNIKSDFVKWIIK